MFLPWVCWAVSAVAIVQADKGSGGWYGKRMEVAVKGREMLMEEECAAKRVCGDGVRGVDVVRWQIRGDAAFDLDDFVLNATASSGLGVVSARIT